MSAGATLVADLDEALAHGRIVPHFQPQIDVRTGSVVAFEALGRWLHPRLGAVAPKRFIELAERTNRIGLIGQSMLDAACRFAAACVRVGRPAGIAVNVSPGELLDGDLFDRVGSALRRHGLDRRLLTLELTESPLIEPVGRAMRLLRRLRETGVGISIDDLGAGSASAERLTTVPATELKIDRSVLHDSDRAAEFDRFVTLGKEHGMRIVVEGVETAEQYERVRDAGCDRAQGYLFSPAVPSTEAMKFLDGSQNP
jgi:EAL domain-containing protein (putative c-di-GMP-specific phosphodiesterase class I)